MSRTTALAALAATAATALALAPGAMAQGPPEQSLLWSTTAPTAKIVKSGSNYLITMPQSSPTVWFTDRPGRSAGTTTLQGFVGGWETNEFDKVPPNAAVVLRRGGVTTQTVVVLTRPKELASNNIQFRARVLPKGDVMDMKTMNRKLPTGTFRNAALFIDAGDAPACPSMITSPGWCTLASSNDNEATTTVDLGTPSRNGVTRTVRSCYWTGDHELAGKLYWQDTVGTGGVTFPLKSYSLDKTTSKCNSPSFSALDDATWTFAPFNYYGNGGVVLDTRNHSIKYTLTSRKEAYGYSWRLYSTPKALIVVTDS